MKILIIGAGAFGLAICHILNKNNHDVYIYDNDKSYIQDLIANHISKKFNYKIDYKVKIVNEIEQKFDIVFICIPSEYVEEFCKINKTRFQNTDIVLTSKGFDHKNNQTFDQTLYNMNYKDISVLSGANLAKNILHNDCNIAFTIATKNNSLF